MTHYYVSGVVVTTERPAYFQIMEEKDEDQVCIAMVPFNKYINPVQGREPALRDAEMIVRALNFYTERNKSCSDGSEGEEKRSSQ